MSPRAAVLTSATVLASVAVVAPAAATVDSAGSGAGSLRITDPSGAVLARAVWHEQGDELCVHATRREAVAKFRTSSGRTVSVSDFSTGDYWTCSNLNVPEDDRVRMVLRWKYLGLDRYARTASTRITT